jgi:hypothetical protein
MSAEMSENDQERGESKAKGASSPLLSVAAWSCSAAVECDMPPLSEDTGPMPGGTDEGSEDPQARTTPFLSNAME